MLRKPLVIVAGQIQQISASDTLDAHIVEQEVISLTNDEASIALVIGTPVYIDAANGCKRAQANASGTANVVGLVADASITASSSGAVITSGVLVATTAQWNAVAGTTGGLVAGTVYYLSDATPGQLTATAPTTGGSYVAPIGTAISSTELKLEVEPTILL